MLRSVKFWWGLYGAVCSICMTRLQSSLNDRLVNWVPLSHTNVLGVPKCPRILSLNAFSRCGGSLAQCDEFDPLGK